jgi:hypothetical protein
MQLFHRFKKKIMIVRAGIWQQRFIRPRIITLLIGGPVFFYGGITLAQQKAPEAPSFPPPAVRLSPRPVSVAGVKPKKKLDF